MLNILVQSREAASRLDSPRLQNAARVVPSTSDAAPRGNRLPPLPLVLAKAAREPSRRNSAGAPLSISSLLYLVCVGFIAAEIVAIFFGAGFSLLVPTAGGTISNRAGPEATSLLPSPGNDEQQTFVGQSPAPENKYAAQRSAALPAPPEAPAADGKDDVARLDQVSGPRAPTETSVLRANAPVPAPTSPAATALAPAASGLSNAELTELLHHGDALLGNGDLASARLFYERAASAGDGRAALRLGASFDPEVLGRLGLGKLQASPAEARSWYNRARDLGTVGAKR